MSGEIFRMTAGYDIGRAGGQVRPRVFPETEVLVRVGCWGAVPVDDLAPDVVERVVASGL